MWATLAGNPRAQNIRAPIAVGRFLDVQERTSQSEMPRPTYALPLEPQRKQAQKLKQPQVAACTQKKDKKDRQRNSHRDALIQQDNENVLRCRCLLDCFFLEIAVVEDEEIGVRAVLA